MMLVHSYPLAITLCVITMICWGSWANTLKMEPRSYPFSLFYWDQGIGYVLLPLLVGLTFGSLGTHGRSLIEDLRQGSWNSYEWALLGGAVWNLANVLFMSALDLAGMAVAFPIAIGLALVEGVLINYIAEPKGSPALIFGGVSLVMLAIILDALAYRNAQKTAREPGVMAKGIGLAVSGGILMGLFYYLVQRSISADFHNLEPGRFGPYAAILVYAVGALLSNLLFNTYMMRRPVKGPSATYADYFKPGLMKFHLIGMLGGVINGIGVATNFVASKEASPAIAYGLGQGGTMIAAIWGVFIWKETRGVSKPTQVMIALMFVCFLSGLLMLVTSMTS